jgi:hypothetical protein
MRGFLTVVVTLTLIVGATYLAGDRLGLWDPVAQSARGDAVEGTVWEGGSGGASVSHHSKPFRRRADETCSRYSPDPLFVTTAAQARTRAREFSVLRRKLARLHPPHALRADYRALLASIDDVAAAERRAAAARARDSTDDAYHASQAALSAGERARSQARRLRLRWCADAVYRAAT